MDVEEPKHAPSHLASVFADILNPDHDAKIDQSNRSKKKLKRLRHDASKKSEKLELKKNKSDPSTSSSSSTKTERTKREWDNLHRVKPDSVIDRELERSLVRIATKGVVQLFNAIREHQARVGQAVSESRTTTVKMEKKVKSIVKKDKFLDLVSKSAKSYDGKTGRKSIDDRFETKEVIKREEEDVDLNTKRWDVLRDDFLLNSGKDWDKDV